MFDSQPDRKATFHYESSVFVPLTDALFYLVQCDFYRYAYLDNNDIRRYTLKDMEIVYL